MGQAVVARHLQAKKAGPQLTRGQSPQAGLNLVHHDGASVHAIVLDGRGCPVGRPCDHRRHRRTAPRLHLRERSQRRQHSTLATPRMAESSKNRKRSAQNRKKPAIPTWREPFGCPGRRLSDNPACRVAGANFVQSARTACSLRKSRKDRTFREGRRSPTNRAWMSSPSSW